MTSIHALKKRPELSVMAVFRPLAPSIALPQVAVTTQLEKDYAEVSKGLNRALSKEARRLQQARAAVGVVDFSGFTSPDVEVNGFKSLI